MHGQIPPHLIDTVNWVVRTSRRMLNEIGREPTPERSPQSCRCPSKKCGSCSKSRLCQSG
jgi:RNA polymerase primary sigma factor